jgi:hypothetical protein
VTFHGALAGLIGETATADFLDYVWGRDIAYYRGPLPLGENSWLTLDAFEAALATLNRAPEGWLHLARDGLSAVPPSFTDSEGLLDMVRLGAALAAGHTLYLTKAERIIPSLARVCAELADQLIGNCVLLRSKINAHVFLTPPGSQGFAPHRDEHASFILQMQGTKDWTIYAPQREAAEGPRPGAIIADSLLDHRRIEVTLKAGDVLYMPEWWPHEARSTDTHSLHVTIRIFPMRWSDLLQQLSSTRSLARSVPRAAAATSGALAAALRDVLNEPGLLDEFSVPPPPKQPASRTGLFREVLTLHQLTLDTLLRRTDGLACEAREQSGSAELSYPGGAIRGPSEFLPVFQFVARTERFYPREFPDIAAHYDRLELAQRIVNGGLMRVGAR